AQSEETEDTFYGYPYCTGCESSYTDEFGDWNYVNNDWCKVKDSQCNKDVSCEPVNGFPCCEGPSPQVEYVDFDGEWSKENDNWCIIN
ncbi:Non-catalytic module family DOC2, partial [Piromyces sp. E2]